MASQTGEMVALGNGIKVSVLHLPRGDGTHLTMYGLPSHQARSGQPTIVLLHGSGANSVFPRTANGTAVPLLFHALRTVQDKWNVYFVEKRGVEFGEKESERGAQVPSAEYRQHASYQGRIEDVCLVLDHFSAEDSCANRPLVLIGSSEGSDVAIGVAARHSAPTHIALLPFSAGHGLFDSLTGLRAEFERGDITATEFKEQYDWLVDTFHGILGPDGDSAEDCLWGHTHKRWHSHCSGAVLNDLLNLEIPVFLGIPSLDSCIGIDLAVAECVKHGKTNLTYRNYPNYDHGFFEHTYSGAVCRHSEVLAEVLNWVKP